MKTLISILYVATGLFASTLQADERAVTPGAVAAPKPDPGVVPAGKLYVLLDSGGKQIGEFKSGQKTPLATTDCAQVKCPSTFDKNVVCWKCVERIKAK